MAIANNQIETNENKNKEKEVKQYIVVQIGSEKYGIDISYQWYWNKRRSADFPV